MTLKITYAIYYLSVIAASYIHLSANNLSEITDLAMAFTVPTLVLLAFKLVKLKYTKAIILVNYTFCFFSLVVGNLFGGYSVLHFDKALHLVSGLIITLLFAMIFEFYCKQKVSPVIKYGFIIGMNMTAAYFWEMFEYFCLIFLKIDAINHYTQGVIDTMNDMTICFVASCFIVVLLVGKNKWLNKLINEFVIINSK